MALEQRQTSPLTVLATSPPVPSSPPFIRDVPRTSHQRRTPLGAASHSDPGDDQSSSSSSSTPSPTRSPTRHRAKRSRRGRSDREKLLDVLDFIHEINWTFKKFVDALFKYGQEPRVRTARARVLDKVLLDLPKDTDYSKTIGKDRSEYLLDRWGHDAVIAQYVKELNDFLRTETFGSFQGPGDGCDRGSLDHFSMSASTFQTVGPSWYTLFQKIWYSNSFRTDADQSQTRLPLIVPWQATIVGILCHILSPKSATAFQTALGLYLYQGGARRRVIETLNSMGLCISYTTTQRRMDILKSQSQGKIREVGQRPGTIVSYDNYEYTEGRRGERTGDKREFRSITTAVAILGRSLDPETLLRYNWRPIQEPLSSLNLIHRFQSCERYQHMRLVHLEGAFRALFDRHPACPDVEIPWMFNPPAYDRLSTEKTEYYPLSPVFKDESTTSNNIAIMQNIFRDQFQIDEQSNCWKAGYRLVVGDVKTWARMQDVKFLRQSTTSHPFESFSWTIPMIGLWHLRYNTLQLIHTMHWGLASPPDPSTLQFAADHWNRSRVVQPSDFQALEDLIIQSYQTRIVSAWLARNLENRQSPQSINEIIPMIQTALYEDGETWRDSLSQVAQILQPPLPSRADRIRDQVRDQEHENHRNFCTHVEAYLSLRMAIKYGDIELLRMALRNLAIIFQAAAAGTQKYAIALLSMLHLVDSPAASDGFQRTVLANSLVNLQGKSDTFFEVDRLLELLNNSLKAFQNERSYFSNESDRLLEAWALNSPYLIDVKARVEAAFGNYNSPQHPPKATGVEIWSLALRLLPSSIRKSKEERFSWNPTENLFGVGSSASVRTF